MASARVRRETTSPVGRGRTVLGFPGVFRGNGTRRSCLIIRPLFPLMSQHAILGRPLVVPLSVPVELKRLNVRVTLNDKPTVRVVRARSPSLSVQGTSEVREKATHEYEVVFVPNETGATLPQFALDKIIRALCGHIGVRV